jgi:uncharacterized membrane protein
MRRQDITQPRQSRGLGVHYDPDAFGKFSEGVARYLGTARFLVIQTIVAAVWLLWNNLLPERLQFDPNPFGVLTLALSLQAAYAAPLILLAQNRQEERDRSQQQSDRQLNARTQADTEFLAREIAGVRLAMGDVATTEDLREHLDKLTDLVQRLADRLDELEDPSGPRRAAS